MPMTGEKGEKGPQVKTFPAPAPAQLVATGGQIQVQPYQDEVVSTSALSPPTLTFYVAPMRAGRSG